MASYSNVWRVGAKPSFRKLSQGNPAEDTLRIALRHSDRVCCEASAWFPRLVRTKNRPSSIIIRLYYITLFYGFNTLVFCNLHCIYNTPNYGCTSMLTFILNVLGEVLGIGNLYCRPFYSAGSGPCARPRDFENRLLSDVLANFGRFLPPLILE